MSKKSSDVDKVLQYMEQQNRPYSVNDVFLNLHKEVGKTALQKVFDQLVVDGSIREKVYGKQKVYVINQDRFPTVDEEQMKVLALELSKLQEDYSSASKCIQEHETKLKTLGSSMTTEEAMSKCKLLEQEIKELSVRLKHNEENMSLISKEEKENITKKHATSTKEWRKRKRMVNDVLDCILEGWPKTKKELFDDIGIETDEDVGVKLTKT